MAIADLPKAIEITGRIAITETTNEARLSCAQSAGVARVQWSSLLEANTCPLCAALDGKVFEAAKAEFNPPAHINCNCIWVERGDDEVGPVDWFDPGEPGSEQEQEWVNLIGRHGHFLHDEETYAPLRIPAGPTGRDFTFRRRRNPETGQPESVIEWKRPRYDLGDLTGGGQYTPPAQIGVTEVGERWRPVGGSGTGPAAPPPGGPAGGPPRQPLRTRSQANVSDGESPSERVPIPSGEEHAATAAEAEARARELGVVEVSYGIAVDLGNHVNEGIRQAAKHGIRAPEAVAIGIEPGLERAPMVTVADGLTGEYVVLVNADHDVWNDVAGRIVQARREGFISSDSPYHLVWNELGHVAHLHHDWQSYLAQADQPLSDAEATIARKLISAYAAMDQNEFVAEVFAAMMAGRTFDDEVMTIYHALGGPPL